MGVYPNLDLTREVVERKGVSFSLHEINQSCPRQAKNNLVFYTINKVYSGFFNCCLVSNLGELLMQGANDNGQLLLK